MYKLIIATCLSIFIIGCKGDQAATADTTTAKTTTINTPIKVADNTAKPKVDVPPAGVANTRTSNGMAPLGSITNPIMKGAISSAPPRTNPMAQPGAQAPVRKPEPAQNAQGVWHFVCTDGCKGGAGKAQACAGCGKTLVHNQAYHGK